MPKWEKGKSGNPKGRVPIIQPELQSALESNRNAVKQLTLNLLGMTIEDFELRAHTTGISVTEAMLIKAIDRATNDGDIFRARAILEIVFGKLPEEKDAFEVSHEEKQMVMEYRRRMIEGPKE